jgi:Flp pilus assembly protein TadD
MVATKNPRRKVAPIFAVAILIIVGCKPAGPSALLQGDEFLRQGNTGAAIEKLKRATSLMPDEPRAWNLLGLAYHHAGEPRLAVQAYRQALAKDRSNVVAVTHYNLGSLLLEQGNTAAAADELRSYTLITNSAPGLVKLGTAQGRLRQLDLAERSFTAALRLDPKNYEALNGIGVIRAQRNQRDAVQYFNSALQANPKYGPAILNAAVLAYHNPATKPASLQRCRDYLALHPKSQEAEAVKEWARQLEAELTPLRPVVSTTVVAQANPPPKTNLAVAPLMQTNAAPLRAVLQSNPPKNLAVATKTNIAIPTRTNHSPTAAVVPTNLPVTVVNVASSPFPKIAMAEPLVSTAAPGPIVGSSLPQTPAEVSSPAAPAVLEEPPKKGFFTRLNPFRTKPKQMTEDSPRALLPAPSPAIPSAETEAVLPFSQKPSFPRYVYKSPVLPAPGDRVEAERIMQQAVKAYRSGNTNEALRFYQVSIKADPGYFEAQYNSALLAFQSGDLGRSLIGWEMTLAIEPDSLNARYNFALTLKQGGYAIDAANELEKILEAKPTDGRAHLSLANLYAQQLNEREKARVHYLKLLELEPRNPQASAIRFWLAANP